MLHYTISGDDTGLPVLFLHGFMGNHADWISVAERLGTGYRCVLADLPGHGQSVGLPDEAYTMPGATQSLASMLDHLNVDRCAVVGYSMGGRLALFMALTIPERCAALVLESASPGLATKAERAARRASDADLVRRLKTEDRAAFLEAWYRQPLFASLERHPDLRAAMVGHRQQNDPVELGRSLAGMGTGAQSPLWERLGGLTVSTLAVAGTLDAKYADLAQRMAARSDRIEARLVPEAGHIVHAEQPGAFVGHLTAFLRHHLPPTS